ncbi:hypothetical protein VC87395_001926 [Vibrio paracholerae 87395]|nr:hypothetical protein VC87395_001926 [Vibrio paracholerae 87395]
MREALLFHRDSPCCDYFSMLHRFQTYSMSNISKSKEDAKK